MRTYLDLETAARQYQATRLAEAARARLAAIATCCRPVASLSSHIAAFARRLAASRATPVASEQAACCSA